MKIVFNLHGVGLGNNGGSRTLIRCGETLARLGHHIVFFSDTVNKYTWHTPVGVSFVRDSIQPSCDVAVATGFKSVGCVLRSKALKKFYYIRGFESWVTNTKNLLKSYRSLRCVVNSKWLKQFLTKHKIHCDLVYPGLDFEWFSDEESINRPYAIGAIYSKKHGTKRHQDAVRVSKMLNRKLVMLNKNFKGSPQILKQDYNQIKVWFAPTELEGLHNPPMEAGLCGCVLVCTDHPRSGMADYARHEDTALVYPARDLEIAAGYINRIIKDPIAYNRLVDNLKFTLEWEIRDRDTNMRKLVNIFNS